MTEICIVNCFKRPNNCTFKNVPPVHGLAPRLPPEHGFLTQGPGQNSWGPRTLTGKRHLYFSLKSHWNIALLLAVNRSETTVVNSYGFLTNRNCRCFYYDISSYYVHSALHCHLIYPKILLFNLQIKQPVSFSEKEFVDFPRLSKGSVAQES